MIALALFAGDLLFFVLRAFGQCDGWWQRGLDRMRAEGHQIVLGQFHAIEWRFAVLDNLANVEAEFFERRVAARLLLLLRQADMLFFLVAAVFASDLVQAAL